MIDRDLFLVLTGVAAGVAASLATGLVVRVALAARARVSAQDARDAVPREPARAAAAEAGGESEIAVALAAVRGLQLQ